MDKNEVKQLLERFYDGTASEREESRLRHYLLSENADAEFAADRKIFQAMQQTETIPMPDDLETRLSSLIDKLDKNERKNKQPKRVKILYMASAIAAAAVLTAILTIRPGGENNGLRPTAPTVEHDISYTARQQSPGDTILAQPASPIPDKVAKAEETTERHTASKPRRNTLSDQQAAEILQEANQRLEKAHAMCMRSRELEQRQAEALQRKEVIDQRTQKALRQLEKARQLEEETTIQLNTNQL